ncbi:MAG: hypothetical protein ACLFTH_01115 [Candidatus Woesearchaeota archaeon]
MAKRATRAVLTLLLIVVLISLTGCTGGRFGTGTDDNPDKEYYKGSEGVRMQFSNPTDPPNRMYYYSDNGRPEDHEFGISVDLHNVGASYTRGGLYVSGYDPYLVHIEGIDIPRMDQGWGDCDFDFDIGGIASGNFWENVAATVNCQGVSTGGYFEGPESWGFRAESLGPLVEKLGLETDILDDVGLSYDKKRQGGDLSFNLGDDFNFDAFNHGKGLILMLSGLSFDRYNGKEFMLAPDNPSYPGGERETFVFNGKLDHWTKGVDKRDVTFMVTNCYLYSTYASPMVCIDPAPMSEGRKVCSPREITYNGGNGAPVAITRIEQENTRRSVYFDIYIKNIGSGTVFDMGQIEKCSPYYPGDLSTRYKDKVYLIDVRIGGQHLECNPDKFEGVRLVSGKEGHVRCRYDLEYVTSKSAYETPLVVEVGYGYSNTMNARTTVKRV